MKENIYLLFGGSSEERLVSVASAQNVAAQLTHPHLWFLSFEGKVFEVTHDELVGHKDPFTKNFVPKSQPLYSSMKEALPKIKASQPVFFLCLHGGEGEDGSLQKLFENEQIAFSGSDSKSSHLAFEKHLAKEIAEKSGVKTVPGILITTDTKAAIQNAVTGFFKLHGPCILKPIAGGSSIGLFYIRSESDIEKTSLSLSQTKGRTYLGEPLIQGRELTIGVIDSGNSHKALPASEIIVDPDRQFDYEGKYLGKGTLEITPAEITPEELKACQAVALTMHKALGCYGYTRTDLFLTKKGPVYLETNTLPGLTRASFIPQQLTAAKITFNDFLTAQIGLAKSRK